MPRLRGKEAEAIKHYKKAESAVFVLSAAYLCPVRPIDKFFCFDIITVILIIVIIFNSASPVSLEVFEMDKVVTGKGDKAQRTRERLLNSSLKLMKEKGFQNTTVREICNDARVSIGTFYSYFPTKDDLFISIYMDGDKYFSESVALSLNDEGTTAEKIVSYFRYYTHLNLNTGLELMKILFQSDNPFFSKHRPMQKVFEDIVSTGLARGELKTNLTAPELVDFFFVLVRGCCYNWCITNGSYDLEKQITDYVRIVLKSMA